MDGRREIARSFEACVLPEVAVLLRVAGSLTEQPCDAEDLVQETLLRAYRAIDRFDGAHPRAWLLTILRHAAASRARRRRPETLSDLDPAATAAADRASVAGAGPEEVVLTRQFDATVARALQRLPERMRRVVELVDLDQLSYAEAASALGVPPGTVMSRLHRGRRRMRAELAAAGVAPTGTR
ncbi:MAG TPA: sigma-70 family RNA polymerase sigma factor [Candidatus Micrarchaeia archaeon]|nr:sigma-70 family RNA polymerase sigma factor [Candidatus Micrarchaeia archaeon]